LICVTVRPWAWVVFSALTCVVEKLLTAVVVRQESWVAVIAMA